MLVYDADLRIIFGGIYGSKVRKKDGNYGLLQPPLVAQVAFTFAFEARCVYPEKSTRKFDNTTYSI
jgi:hypothetical protein